MMVTANYLLKKIEDKELKDEFFETFYKSLVKSNEILKKKISCLTIHKARMHNFLNIIQDVWRKEMEDEITHRNTFVRTKMKEYIESYTECIFIIKETSTSYELSGESDQLTISKGIVGSTVKEFVNKIKLFDIRKIIVNNTDYMNLLTTYKKYMKLIEETIYNDAYKGLKDGEKEGIYTAIKSYIITELYEALIPDSPSDADVKFRSILVKLSSISPERLKFTEEDLELDFWSFATQCNYCSKYLGLSKIDQCHSATAIIEVLDKVRRILLNGLETFIKVGKEISADDQKYAFSYLLIKTLPIKFISHYKYTVSITV